jgi:hypothetical protein
VPAPGLEFVEATCGGCRSAFVGRVLGEGREILSVEEIPQPPAAPTVMPEPAGLDAVTPAAAPKRRRRARVRNGAN